jgi:hypothetical protein
MTNYEGNQNMNHEHLNVEDIAVFVRQEAVKTLGAEFAQEKVEQQAEIVRSNLIVTEGLKDLYSGCSDERGRDGQLDGQPGVARFQVFGGNATYFVNINALLGFGSSDDAEDSFKTAINSLDEAGFKPGMHQACAALNGVHPVMAIIHNKPNMVLEYAQAELGDEFDENYANQLIVNAGLIITGAKFENFRENNLQDLLVKKYGEAEAYKAVELIRPGLEHAGYTIARIKKPNVATDASAIFDASVFGRGSYIFNDAYASSIENLVASGPHATEALKLARHAREFIIRATLEAVPNPELRQFTLS